ncbi:MAG: ABC transporter permease, partial [Nitrospiraceae bacterium]
MDFIEFFISHREEVLRLTAEHLVLVGLSTGGAVLIGIPLGVGLARNPRWRAPVLGFVNVIQTI